ncbi:MAG: hypothetical protein ACT4OX_09000 [Actinomycetota bacterium]
MTQRACENCGVPDDELVLVHRVYVRPETWDQPASHSVVPDAELWCVSCCSQYPHQTVDDEAASD